MQPLFGSETDGIQERKLVKRLLRKKKITFILRVDLSLAEYRI